MSVLTSWQESELPKVEKQLKDFVQTHAENEQLKESMLYSINAGGKRIRPLLVLATVEFFLGTVLLSRYIKLLLH